MFRRIAAGVVLADAIPGEGDDELEAVGEAGILVIPAGERGELERVLGEEGRLDDLRARAGKLANLVPVK